MHFSSSLKTNGIFRTHINTSSTTNTEIGIYFGLFIQDFYGSHRAFFGAHPTSYAFFFIYLGNPSTNSSSSYYPYSSPTPSSSPASTFTPTSVSTPTWHFYLLSPKILVPIRTKLAPSSMATL